MNTSTFRFQLENLSKYRSSLMGISIIMILLCHARMDGAQLPNIILSILSLGNWGVDIFLLLSGIGMYYSISKCYADINWGVWIYKRLKRILVPYLILETPFWLWYAINNDIGIKGFLYYITFASYWIEHIGLWFLALLIPLYILTPVLYKLFDNRFRYLYLFFTIVIVLVGSVIPFESSSETMNTVQGCLSRVPCYLIGLCIGCDVKNKKCSSWFIIWPFLVYALMKILNCYGIFISKSWLWGIVITIILTFLLRMLPNIVLNALSFIGKYTLELYIGLDLSKNVLIYFMDLSTGYWMLSILGSILIAFLYNCLNVFLRRFWNIEKILDSNFDNNCAGGA